MYAQALQNQYQTPKWQAKILNPDQQFQINNQSISNLAQLKQALQTIENETFYPLIKPHNHIANWIKDSIKDPTLAQLIQPLTTRIEIIVTLERHLMRTLHLPPNVAQRWLENAQDPFIFSDGSQAHNLTQLSQLLSQLPSPITTPHLKTYPNDYAQWIRHSIGIDPLSDQLETQNTLHKTQTLLQDYLIKLEKIAQLSIS